ncbi:hypothetical protein P691DRAFT_782065 [Macrolepiota fuliginosa MF-IS2]|uniref:Iron-sulfur clusters transporter ATM1, mitochondrial n=1 Tax=Macrolepiota fuliginosa MF-IS2 TaxID=1400762 RepID=A0A9P6C8P6_9AGAR|nr:hypothetical protein P691DRAFT_782065 [Macrolepiota fuliginosa MF-IS2]
MKNTKLPNTTNASGLTNPKKTCPALSPSCSPPSTAAAPGTIRFENISFRYHPSHPMFQNLNFEIPLGKCMVIIGPSGCGKFTFPRPLIRPYTPYSGKIYVNDQGYGCFVAQSSMISDVSIGCAYEIRAPQITTYASSAGRSLHEDKRVYSAPSAHEYGCRCDTHVGLGAFRGTGHA